MPFEKHHTALAEGLASELAGGRSSEHEEQTVSTLAVASLRHAYPGAVACVAPAPGRPPGDLGLGVLDVRLSWPFSAEPPLVLRVVVHDELVRGQWRAASMAIGDAVREGLAARCPPPPHPLNRERHRP
jgi:hypothetical protein